MAQEESNGIDTLDISALGVLLQELADDLPSEIHSLLDSPNLRDEILKYLNDISSIESNDYLSSIPPTPAAHTDMKTNDERTLVQDIAELEADQRSIDTNLKNLIIKSQGSIIDNEIGLTNAYELFENEFAHNSKALWRTFKDDDINELKDDQDQDIHDLEIEIDPTAKQDTFYQTISNIKNIQSDENEKSKNLSIVLDNMDQISNILELPSLAGACIKAGYYSEALEISSYTRRLAIRFPQSDLVKQVEAGVRSEMSMMLTGLIRLLRTNLKQSSIIKILSYLRRIQPFSQSENASEQLKRILLHSRYQFIKMELSSLAPLKESELHEKYLKRSIEVIREYCFGSIMTYKSIFPDIDDSEVENVNLVLEEIVGEEKEVKEETKEETKEEVKKEVMQESKEETGDSQRNKTFEEKQEQEVTSNNMKEEYTKQEVKAEEEPVAKEEGEAKEEGTQEVNSQVASAEESNTKDIVEVATEAKEEDKDPKCKEAFNEEIYVPFIRLSKDRTPSNILLFDFVHHVLTNLITNLEASILKVQEQSIRDGLYLQLIYCSQSLGRIDENFSDLMTVTLLNAKDETNNYIIDRTSWALSIEKLHHLAESLSR